MRYAEIVNITVLALDNLSRFDLELFRDWRNIRQTKFPLRRGRGQSIFPIGIVKTYSIPTLNLKISVIKLSETVIITQDRRRSDFKGFVTVEQNLLSLRYSHSKHRSASEICLVEIPDISAGIVLKTVTKQNTKHIFACIEHYVIFIVIYIVVCVADIWRQKTSCNMLPIKIKLIKSTCCHGDLGFDRMI